MKVLISAYACSPYAGSEPGVGWGFITALATYHKLWVIVEEEKFRPSIENYLHGDPELSRRVTFHYIPKKRNRLLRKLWPPSYYFYYRQWQKEAYLLAQELHQEVKFDLVHQLTMVGFREPGYLWKMGIPFVWGPVGGMGQFPVRFLNSVGFYGAFFYLSYNLINWLQLNFYLRPKKAGKAATSGLSNGLITATIENQKGALKYWGCPSILLNEVGLPSEPFEKIKERNSKESLKIIWIGLHIPRKALNLALQGLSLLKPDINWELHIVGSGPLTSKLKKRVRTLKIDSRCIFHGWVPLKQVHALMRNSHLMLITSLRDLTSTVTLEGLRFGLPIVCLDHSGFSEVVNDSCGVKIPLTTPRRVAREIAKKIEIFAQDENIRQTLAHGSLLRAKDFVWCNKARLVDQIYRSKVSRDADYLEGFV